MIKKSYSDINIIEVGPRDGLQNEKTIISTIDKIEYITMLAQAGLKNIEVTSFVKPSAIPQMSDSHDLYLNVQNKIKRTNPSVLVPNLKGYEPVEEFDIKNIALFTATSDTFNKKNINATIDESFTRMKEVVAKASGRRIRVYLSTAFGCPYEGEIPLKKTIDLYERCLKELNADEISVSDTIGVAKPLQVQTMINEIEKQFGLDKCALHFHDTRGMAIANILVGLDGGVTTFDSASGGLGGCPYAKGATGNVATEDLVYLLESLGVKTGVDIDKLADASEFIFSKIGRKPTSKYLVSLLNSRQP
jgi:hydroxymethylglutaryl-CoA lyase